MNKKIAIIIPTYNSSKYIRECLNSAIGQDYENLEIIVVDNESTDDTLDEIRDTVKNMTSPFERAIRTDVAPNLYKYSWDEPTRKALELMSADVEYFMFLASDDKLKPDFISNNMKIIEKSGFKIRALQSFIEGFGAQTGLHGYSYKDLDEFKEICLNRCPVNTPTIVWHKSVWTDGLLESKPETYFGATDYWMYCNQADKGLFIYPFPKSLGYMYRWCEEQATWGMHRDFKGTDKKIQIFWSDKWKKG